MVLETSNEVHTLKLADIPAALDEIVAVLQARDDLIARTWARHLAEDAKSLRLHVEAQTDGVG